MSTDDRFYPDHVPPVTDEPRRADVHLRSFGPIVDEGVASGRELPAGTVLGFWGAAAESVTLHTMEQDGTYLEDPYFLGKILHSCEPNAEMDMPGRRIVVLSTIPPGAPVTIDYERYEYELYRPFQCLCGAERCRGMIRGRRYREEETGDGGDDPAVLEVGGIPGGVQVDGAVRRRVADLTWVRAGGRVVSFSLPGYLNILDLATIAGGRGATPDPERPRDYRRSTVRAVPARAVANGEAS